MTEANLLSEQADLSKYTTDEDNKENHSVDLVERTIGSFGKWQFRMCFLMSLLKILITWYEMSIIYLNPTTNFWCNLPPKFNNTNISSSSYEVVVANSTNIIIQENSCFLTIDLPQNATLTPPCVWGYDYNTSIIETSIVTNWNLVCDYKYLANLSQTIMMCGVMLGSTLLGLAADRYGRKNIIIFSTISSTILSGLLAIFSSFGSFLVFRFLLGLAVGGISVTSMVMGVEVVGNKWRSVASNTYQSFVGIGYITLAGLAYIFRHWRELQLSFTFFNMLCISYLFLIEESPRWLMLVGKKEKTKKVLDRICEINKTKQLVALDELQATSILKKEQLGLKSLFESPRLRKTTIILSLSWLAVGITFFGLGQYVGQATNDIYSAVAITGIFLIPGYIISIPLIKSYGRRRIAVISAIVIPFGYLAILNITADWVKILFFGLNFIIMGIFGASFHLLTNEIYPTVVRNCGVGYSLTFERIGAMIAPLVLSQTWVNPFWIFFVLAILQPFLIYPLSETYEINLYETIEDLEQFNAT